MKTGQIGVRAGRTPMSPGVIARRRAGTSPWHQGFPASHGRAVVAASPGIQNRWAYHHAQHGTTPPMAVGGSTAAQMAVRNAEGIAEYALETAAMIAANGAVEPWVANKLSRARTDLGDVKHFLENPHPVMSVGRQHRGRTRRKKSWLDRLLGR